MRPPIPDSYWVVPGQLLAGEYPGAKLAADAEPRLAAFTAAGITSFVDLTEESEGLSLYSPLIGGARCKRLPIRDGGCPTPAEMRAILDWIDSEIADGHVVYVHCWGGHGRTGTVIGCWLVRHGAVPKAALAQIAELRREVPDAAWMPSPETGEQTKLVERWLRRDGEAALTHAVRVASPALAQLSTHHELGEIRDLQPEIVAALQALLRNGIWPNAKISIPGWDRVGHVDVAVRDKDDEDALLLAAELKWGKPDEAVWDVFKMALLATEAHVAATFLVGGLSKKQLENGFCADLLDTARHSTVELCARRYPTGARRYVWDWMLEGGWDHYPKAVPAEIATRLVARETIDAAGAELRVVRVLPFGHDIAFVGGWPNGSRPNEAQRPAATG